MTDQLKQLSEPATLTNRLRGVYAIGPDVDGGPEFGHRDFGSTFTPRIQLEAADRIETLETQLTEAKAREAVAYEVAAKVCTGDEDQPERISASALRKMSASEQFMYEQVVLAWKDAIEIRALTRDDTTTALEQIKQEAREPFKKLADDMADILDSMSSEHCLEDAYSMAIDALDLHTEQSAAILATLSEQKEPTQ